MTKYVVAGVVALQVLLACALHATPFWSLKFWAVAYVFGATANQNLFLAIHEISHNLAFRSPLANRLLSIVANLPIGIPYSASFRVCSPVLPPPSHSLPTSANVTSSQPMRLCSDGFDFWLTMYIQPYHLTHHKSLGVDGLDTDLPTAFEALVLDSILGKAFFCTFQIFFYAVRPMAVYRVPFTWVHYLNILVQVSFDLALIRLASPTAFLYLLLSSFLAGSLHPLAGHFIAEHYVYETVTKLQRDPDNRIPVPETFSYYGPLNWFTYNVGLHNEHHDFPAVPWTRLPAVYQVAREFYQDLPRHESWSYAIWRFIWDENVGISCRVKRKNGGRVVGGAVNWKESELQP